MNITGFDFVLVNVLSYFAGVFTGLTVCCKYKDKFMQRSKSTDQINQFGVCPPHYTSSEPPVQAVPSAPPLKLTIDRD